MMTDYWLIEAAILALAVALILGAYLWHERTRTADRASRPWAARHQVRAEESDAA